MAFNLPTFNTTANVWRNGLDLTGPPTLTTPCQLRAAGKMSTGQDATSAYWPFLWSASFPPRTDIRDNGCPSGIDTLEIPAGTMRYYLAVYVDDVAREFLNEYRIAFLQKFGPWPQPIP